VTALGDPETALAYLEESEVDVVITDMKMPRLSGQEVLARVRKSWPHVPVLIMTAFGSIEAAVEAMLREFGRQARKLWPEGLPDPAELKRVVILASLVEKETAVPSERGTVAGVYANRLRLGWLLQCDPTIIYGLGENFDGNLRRRDLLAAAATTGFPRRRGVSG